MANQSFTLLSASLFIYTIIISLTTLPSSTASSCNGPCKTQNDCDSQLICINGKCNDDPEVGTHICGGGGGGGGGGGRGSGSCKPSGHLVCDGKSYPKYYCSPPVTSSTPATLTLNNFDKGGEGGAPSECDDSWHEKWERVVALSTGWYANGNRCGKMVKITAQNGRSVSAKVVDECDSRAGCDDEHGGLPPCDNNIVDGSDAVWEALGLDKDIGQIPVTWSMA